MFINESQLVQSKAWPKKKGGKKNHKHIEKFKKDQDNSAKQSDYLLKFKLTIQQNAHRVFESIENLANISLRVLGNEIFEKECFLSEDIAVFFSIVKELAPDVYEAY